LIPPGKRGGDKRTVIMGEVVNGLMYTQCLPLMERQSGDVI